VSKYVVQATWDDVPHLSEEAKAEMLASTPPHLRDARSRGIPHLGAGSIYPVAEEEILIKDFQFPDYWRRVYGMDVGWNRTAAIWGAHDLESDILYLYAEHYRGASEPPIHAEAINAKGLWIPGVIDPASKGRSQGDGEQLISTYRKLGLTLSEAVNAVEAGIYAVWTRLSTGRLKVFESCQNWLSEYRIYRRDENGKIIKAQDHLMDATRYLVMSGISIACEKPIELTQFAKPESPAGDDRYRWSNRK